MESIKGKNILLAGATGGIGRALIPLLLQSGANLFITGRNELKLKELLQQFPSIGNRYAAADLTVATDVARLLEVYQQQMPSIDYLLNVSGIGKIQSADNLSIEDFTEVLNANLIAPYRLVKTFLPLFKQQQTGLIIHVPGVLGKVPMAGAAAYSASKYGLVGMMQSIREELKRTRIRITNVYMGGVDTAFWDNIDLRVQRNAMIRPDEAARSIWFLCQQPESAVISELVLQPFNHQAI
jgi:short-subunit dehydrogenase